MCEVISHGQVTYPVLQYQKVTKVYIHCRSNMTTHYTYAVCNTLSVTFYHSLSVMFSYSALTS